MWHPAPASLSLLELADWVDHLCAVDGAERVDQFRNAAERLAPRLYVPASQVETLNDVVGAALGQRVEYHGQQLFVDQLKDHSDDPTKITYYLEPAVQR